MCKVIIFGGTTEGRLLAEFMDRSKVGAHVCVATQYGGTLIPEGECLTFSDKRLDEQQMEALIAEKKPEIVIDATHPFAVDVTENIKKACKEQNVQYVRLLRSEDAGGKKNDGEESCCIFVDNIKEAVEVLSKTEGRILVTTGSKELAEFTALENFKERLIARVLSTVESVEHCRKLGIEGKNLICMQGPFSREINRAMIKQFDCKYMVTKASGTTGGFEDKIQAALDCGCIPVVIGRPSGEEGLDFAECKKLLTEKFDIKTVQQIGLVGIGMGSHDTLTEEAKRCLTEAELIIGAKRIAEAVNIKGQNTIFEYNSERIAEYIEHHRELEKIAVVFSGDIGFYSGAKKLITLLREKDYKISVFPGISSVSYFMGRIGLSWDDAVITSNHGITNSLIPLIRDNEKVFSILGRPDDVRNLAGKLIEYGLGEVKLYVGENLSYSDEKIFKANPSELTDYENYSLCVIAAVNEHAPDTCQNPLTVRRDSEFIRGKVPMTKEEIRTISISKLNLKPDSICYDVGAGTGSVSVEMAVKTPKGRVYAIEKKEEAVDLIRQNKIKFMTDNLEVIEGLAPEAMIDLPAPTHVFIGGSSGNMEEIVESVLSKNPMARIVINCIAVESVSTALKLAYEKGAGDTVEVIQVSVARTSKIGPYTMMNGENPITIISFTGKGAQA